MKYKNYGYNRLKAGDLYDFDLETLRTEVA